MQFTGRRVSATALVALVILCGGTIRLWHATYRLDYTRAFDERYTFRNIENFLSGEFSPDNAWYPGLAFLPQTAVLYGIDKVMGVVSPGSWSYLVKEDRFTTEAILVCRLLSVAYGTVSLWLVFLIGRRLFDERVGVMAAALLALAPAHVQLSSIVKPDVLMVCFLLAAFYTALRFGEAIPAKRVLLAGTFVGLAMAAKQYGVVTTVPVCLGLLLATQKLRVRLLAIGAALAVAGAVFLVMNPWLGILLNYAGRARRIYGGRSQGRMNVLLEGLRFPFGDAGHGPAIGLLAFVGIGLVVIGIVASRTSRAGRILLVTTAVGYLGFCVAVLPWSKYNLWMPILPLTSITAGYAVAQLWDRLGSLRRSSLVAVLGVGLLGAAVAPNVKTLYEGRVPPTSVIARDVFFVMWRDGSRSLVYQEDNLPDLVLGWKYRKRFAVAKIPSLVKKGERKLDLADGEVFPASRLDGEDGDFYRRRMKTYEDRSLVIERGWFKARGDDLVLIEHAWRRQGRPLSLALEPSGSQFEAPLTNGGKGRVIVSLDLWLGRYASPEGVLRVNGKKVQLVPVRKNATHMRYITPRFKIPPRREFTVSVRLPEGSELTDDTFPVLVHRWKQRRRPARVE